MVKSGGASNQSQDNVATKQSRGHNSQHSGELTEQTPEWTALTTAQNQVYDRSLFWLHGVGGYVRLQLRNSEATVALGTILRSSMQRSQWSKLEPAPHLEACQVWHYVLWLLWF
jgi:hypothetical protein